MISIHGLYSRVKEGGGVWKSWVQGLGHPGGGGGGVNNTARKYAKKIIILNPPHE